MTALLNLAVIQDTTTISFPCQKEACYTRSFISIDCRLINYNLPEILYLCCFDAIYNKGSLFFPFQENNNPNMDPGVQLNTKQNLPAKE